MKLKLNILIFILFLILCSFVVTGKPVVTQTAPEQYFVIEVPEQNNIIYGMDFDLYFHLYNTTGHEQRSTTTTCIFHLYNKSGMHIIEEFATKEPDLYEFYVQIPANLTKVKGYYPFLIHCNGSGRAGYYQSGFDYSFDGQQPDLNYLLPLILGLISIPIILILISKLIDDDTEFQQGFKLLSVIIAVAFTGLIANFLTKISMSTYINMTGEIAFKGAIYFIYGFNIILFIAIFYGIMKLLYTVILPYIVEKVRKR